MRRPALLAALPLVLALVATTPEDVPVEDCRTLDDAGTPDDTGDDRGVCTVGYWLGCEAAIAGKAHVAAPPFYGANVALGREEPAGSFTAGEGCGEFENSGGSGVSQDNIHDFTFEGDVAGNIDSVAVELHDIFVGPERNGTTMPLQVRFAIDGVSPWGTQTVDVAGTPVAAPAFFNVVVEPEVSSTGLSVAYRFTVTGLDTAIGTANEFGFGDDSRQVKITVDTPNGLHVFVWGATEVPSGITLNPEAVIGTEVVAPIPPPSSFPF